MRENLFPSYRQMRCWLPANPLLKDSFSSQYLSFMFHGKKKRRIHSPASCLWYRPVSPTDLLHACSVRHSLNHKLYSLTWENDCLIGPFSMPQVDLINRLSVKNNYTWKAQWHVLGTEKMTIISENSDGVFHSTFKSYADSEFCCFCLLMIAILWSTLFADGKDLRQPNSFHFSFPSEYCMSCNRPSFTPDQWLSPDIYS